MKRRRIWMIIFILFMAMPYAGYLLLPQIIAPIIAQKLNKLGCKISRLSVAESRTSFTQISELYCNLPEVAEFHLKNIKIEYSLGKIYLGQIGRISVESAEINMTESTGADATGIPIPQFFVVIPVSDINIEKLKINYPFQKNMTELNATVKLQCWPTSISGELEGSAAGLGNDLKFHSMFKITANQIHLKVQKLSAKQKMGNISLSPNSDIKLIKDGEKLHLETPQEILLQTTIDRQKYDLRFRELKLDQHNTLLASFYLSIDSALPEVLVSLDLDQKNKHAAFKSKSTKINMAKAIPFIYGLMKLKEPQLKITNGEAEISILANVNFQKTAFLENAQVLGKLTHVSGEAKGVYFDELSFPLNFMLEKDSMILEKALLEISTLKSGLTLTNIKVMLGAQKKDLLSGYDVEIPNAQADLFSGSLKTQNIFYNSERPKAKFHVDFSGLSLQQLIAFQKQDNISGTGTLDGTLPIELFKNEVTVKEGIVRARAPGGSISYLADESLSSVASANSGFKLAIDALRNFQYQVLEGKVNFSRVGNMDLALRLEGNNPEWNNGRPVHFNLTISENVLDLLKSVRMAEDLSGALENKMRKKVK